MAKPTEKQKGLLERFGCDVPEGRREAGYRIDHASLGARVDAQELHGVPNELRYAVALQESPQRTEVTKNAVEYLRVSGIRVGSVVDRFGERKLVVQMRGPRDIGLVSMTTSLHYNLVQAGGVDPSTNEFQPTISLVANPLQGFVHINCTGFFSEAEDPTTDRKRFTHSSLHDFILSRIDAADRQEWEAYGTVVRVEPARALVAAFVAASAERTRVAPGAGLPFCSACGVRTTRRNHFVSANRRCRSCAEGGRTVSMNEPRYCTKCGTPFVPEPGKTNATCCAAHTQIKRDSSMV